MQFKDLGLVPEILKAAVDAGYENPSPVQEKAIPPVLLGQDLLACAQTGTGKTAAFAMPILQRLNSTPSHGVRHIRTLVLTPTRELALQIHESFVSYGKYLKLKSYVIFGGVSQNPQVDALKRGTDILVATPGRLIDLINQGFVKLDKLEIFVLDEADRMLDMGFIHDIKRVLAYLPTQKQTLLFSATMPSEIEELVNKLLCKPAKIYVTPPSTTVQAISQSLYFVDKKNKQFLLANLLDTKNINTALVFTRTKHGANNVVKALDTQGITAMAIHGNKSQNARQAALSSFKDGKLRVLVATDIAARGIDINELEYVFNYDLPEVPETYVHRIGRTGRAGQNGIAISFCCFDEKPLLADIEKLTGKKIAEISEHKWQMQILEATPKENKTRQGQPRPKRGVPSQPRNDKDSQSKKPQVKPAAEKQDTPRSTNPYSKLIKNKKAFAKPENSFGKSNNSKLNDSKPNNKPNNSRVNSGRPNDSRVNSGRVNDSRVNSGRVNDSRVNSGRPNDSRLNDSKPQRASQNSSFNAKPIAPSAPRQEKPAHVKSNSLNVVSRKSPSQKYASFDEYMNSKK